MGRLTNRSKVSEVRLMLRRKIVRISGKVGKNFDPKQPVRVKKKDNL